MQRLLYLESMFWLLALLIAAAVLFPLSRPGVDFPLIGENMILIITAVILLKHLFLLEYSVINRWRAVKIALIPLSVPFAFYLIRLLSRFTLFMDEQSLTEMCISCAHDTQMTLANYVRIEYLLFGVMAIAAAILLPLKLLRSVWREINRR